MKNYIFMIKGTIISIVLTIVFLFCYSLILANTNINENYMEIIILSITLFCILVGTIIATRKMEKKGIYNGLCVAVGYLGFLYIISLIIKHSLGITKEGILLICMGLFSGIIGGIIGTNLK